MNARLELDVHRGATLVPEAAVQRGHAGDVRVGGEARRDGRDAAGHGRRHRRPGRVGRRGPGSRASGSSSTGAEGSATGSRRRSARALPRTRGRVVSISRPFIRAAGRDDAPHGGDPAARARSATGASRSPRCRRSTIPTIQVVTFYPGASPDVMASSVDRAARAPVRADAGPRTDDVDELRRRARSSRCSSPSTCRLDVAEQEVQAAINAAFTLPAEGPSRSRRSTAR